MSQFCVLIRLNAIKKNSFWSHSEVHDEKNIRFLEFYLRALFYKNFSTFCLLFKVTERLVTLHIEVPQMTNLHYSHMEPNEQKNPVAHFSLASTLSFGIFE